ncbi:MAG: hypothetical protein IKS21_03735, partial [Oscillospiraceae bacterium]|nr:hypothetical protein [Oscillospiraceae bacterium]
KPGDDFHVLRFRRSFLSFREIVCIPRPMYKEALPQFSGFRCFETTPFAICVEENSLQTGLHPV